MQLVSIRSVVSNSSLGSTTTCFFLCSPSFPTKIRGKTLQTFCTPRFDAYGSALGELEGLGFTL